MITGILIALLIIFGLAYYWSVYWTYMETERI